MSERNFEVHPEHLALCVLASALVVPPPRELGWGVNFDGVTAQRSLAALLLQELYDTTTPVLTPLPRLLHRLQSGLGAAAGQVLGDALIASLSALRLPDDLINAAAGFASLLAPPGAPPAVVSVAVAQDADSIPYIATVSPLGVLLRRVRLGLRSMNVQRLAALAARVQQAVDAARCSSSGNGGSCDGGSSGSGRPAALREPAALAAHVNRLLAEVEARGAALPLAAVEAALAPLEHLAGSELPQRDCVRAAAAAAHGDAPAALNSQLRYFDAPGGGGGGSAGGGGTNGTDRRTGRTHSALNSLAALHTALGQPGQARGALQELLRLGQQHRDDWALAHALAALCATLDASGGLPAGSNAECPADWAEWAGWGLLDFRRTEAQLQLHALLRRSLATACELRMPHLVAYSAVALCRFLLLRGGAAGSGSWQPLDSGGGGEPPHAGGGTVLAQRLLLDVMTLHHQASVAAAAPAPPAAALTPPVAPAVGGGGGGAQTAATVALRAAGLFAPTEAFGTAGPGGSGETAAAAAAAAAAPNSAADPAADAAAVAQQQQQQQHGWGWRAAAAGVSQALASAQLVAAGAFAEQGAPALAAVQVIALLCSPGLNGSASSSRSEVAQVAADTATPAVLQAPSGDPGARLAAATGCAQQRCEHSSAAWGLLADLAAQRGGTAAGTRVLELALQMPHGKRQSMPHHLAAAAAQLRLSGALAAGDAAAAREAAAAMRSLVPSQPGLRPELQLAAIRGETEAWLASGDWAAAHSAAASLFALSAAAGLTAPALEGLVLLGRAALGAGDAANALPYALSALHHAQTLGADAALLRALLLLARCWAALAPGGASLAATLLCDAAPLAHGAGGPAAAGELQATVARLQLQLAQELVGSVPPVHAGDAARESSGTGAGAETLPLSPITPEVERDSAPSCLREPAARLAAAGALLEASGEWLQASDAWLSLAHVHDATSAPGQRDTAAAAWMAVQEHLAPQLAC